MNLTLTVVDTPGFGVAIDNSDCWESVLTYVESQVGRTNFRTQKIKKTLKETAWLSLIQLTIECKQLSSAGPMRSNSVVQDQWEASTHISKFRFTFQTLIKYIFQYENFLEAETKVKRNPNMPDTRVHACLYFIAPSG